MTASCSAFVLKLCLKLLLTNTKYCSRFYVQYMYMMYMYMYVSGQSLFYADARLTCEHGKYFL